MFKHLRSPDFKRLTKALSGGQPDAVPLIELGIHSQIKQSIMGKPVITIEDEISFMSSMGYDFVKIQPHFRLKSGIADKQNTLQNGDRIWASVHSGLIKTLDDVERFPWPKLEEISYARFEEAFKVLPDGLGVIGQYGDIFTLAWELMGFESFAIASYEDPLMIKSLIDKIGSINLSMFETMASMDKVGALWYSDDLAYSSGLLMSPSFYREYLFTWVKKIGDLAKKRNIPFIYHSDGLLYPIIDDLIGCGVTSLHPIEPKAMVLKEVKERYRNRLSICGNIELDTLCQGTEDEVRQLVFDALRNGAPGGGFCLGSSNSIPDYVNPQNYLVMVETALENGWY